MYCKFFWEAKKCHVYFLDNYTVATVCKWTEV
jgi:hypothetical protein